MDLLDTIERENAERNRKFVELLKAFMELEEECDDEDDEEEDEDDDEEEEADEEDYEMIQDYLNELNEKIPRKVSIKTGKMYLEELLTQPSPVPIFETLRMKKQTFLLLCDELRALGLKDNKRSANTICLKLEEKVAIFLDILGSGSANRTAANNWQHSNGTISRAFTNVLLIVGTKFLKKMVVQPTSDTPTSSKVRLNPRWSPYFDNAVGAFDGTHVPLLVAKRDAERFRSRKGHTSTNVLAACNFSYEFTYIYAGFEGRAHDSKVLRSAMLLPRNPFRIPDGKIYLADAGYGVTEKILVPYKGERYHLNEYRNGRQPRTKEEMYNLRHSQLRMSIEKIFGVLQKKFPFITRPIQYKTTNSINKANLIIYSCAGNLIYR